MARKATTKTETKKENTVADTKEVEGLTFEIMDDGLPTAKRGNRRSWFAQVAEKVADNPGVWIKVREYNSLSTLRSTASGSLKKSFPDYRFSTRKTGEDTGDLFALYAGPKGEHLPNDTD